MARINLKKINKKPTMAEIFQCVFFLFLVVALLYTRFWNLSVNPLGMHIDEAGLGLNAWSIANFGTDRYGNILPICPINFYGEQSAFYTYFCAFFVKLFGLSALTLRLPAAIMGCVTVIFGSLLIRETFGRKGFFIGATLLTILPYFISSSRYALDCNAMLGALTVALYAHIKLLKKIEHDCKPHYALFALVGLLYGITLYTYIIAAIVIAIILILFGIFYILQCQKTIKTDNQTIENEKSISSNNTIRQTVLQLLCMILPVIILVAPLVLVVAVNYFDLEPFKLGIFSIAKMPINRVSEIASSTNIISKLKGLLKIVTTDGKYGSFDRFWTLSWISLPFLLFGFYARFRILLLDWKIKKFITVDFMFFSVLLAEVILYMLAGSSNYNANGIYVALLYFVVAGIIASLTFLKNKLNKKIALSCSLFLIGIYSIESIFFYQEYFLSDTAVAYQVYDGANSLVEIILKESPDKEIYILDEVGEFYMLSNPVSPEIFVEEIDELGYIKSHGNIIFDVPKEYTNDTVYICNKSSGHRMIIEQALSNPTILENDYYIAIYSL